MSGKTLPILSIVCPQEYDGSRMNVVPCDRCHNWNDPKQRCGIYMGVEHLPRVPASEVTDCPLADRCQHQIQTPSRPCKVRARGLVCESALATIMTLDEAMDHPLAFHADTVAPPER